LRYIEKKKGLYFFSFAQTFLFFLSVSFAQTFLFKRKVWKKSLEEKFGWSER